MAGQGLPAAAPENAAQRFEQTVLGYCARQGLFAPQDRVIAAVSGGADSMALLVFLLRSAAALGIRVEAAHVDHGIRGGRSKADAAFVADFCARHGVVLHAFSAPEEGIPVPQHPSEDWARRLRYGFFARLLPGAEKPPQAGQTPGGAGQPAAAAGQPTAQAQAEPTAGQPAGQGQAGPTTGQPAPQTGPEPSPRVWIATAHTLNDQAETLLFRLARGAGLRGAGGIRPVSGAFVRPLLAVGRAETEGYCAALGIPFVQDETNASPVYARNRLRAVLPALVSANAGAPRHLAAFCERMQRLDGYFAAKGETLLQAAQTPGGWSLAVLQRALGGEEPVLEAALRALLESALGPACAPDAHKLELARQLVARGRGALQLSGGLALTAGQGRLRLCAVRNVSGGGPSGGQGAAGPQGPAPLAGDAPTRPNDAAVSSGACPQACLSAPAWEAQGQSRPRQTPLPPPPQPAPPAPFAPGVYRLPGGYAFSARVERVPRGENFIKLCPIHKKDLNSCADYGKIQGNVLLRTRLPGDTFCPPRRGVTKPLKKLCQELGLSPAARSLRPLLAQGSRVLWFWGQGFAEGLAPGPDTRDVLIITPLLGEKEVPLWE